MTSECPFCEIIAGRAPGKLRGEFRYFEDDLPDIMLEPLNPVTPGHLMVIPGQHVEDFTSDVHVTSRIMGLAGAYAREFGGQWNLITSKGKDATQSVFHFHVHLVPRFEGDGLHLPWTGQVRGSETG